MGTEPVPKIIYNCHTHIFTARSLPKDFLPLGVQKLLKYSWFRKTLLWMAENINPLSNVDIVERMGRFAKVALQNKQLDVFNRLLSYYPENSAFVVLPMDMEFMDYGKMEQSIEEQHNELLQMRNDSRIRHRILPFVHFDPRRNDAVGLMRSYLDKGFIGIKLYPNLGYAPYDENLLNIWELANELHLPVMVHCSRGGVYKKGTTQAQRWEWTKPESYREILLRYPMMKLCLGHFGGNADWKSYLESNGKESSWVKSITNMIREKNENGDFIFPNLYADISYSVFDFDRNVKILKVLLTDDAIRKHTLFGSDFYMTEQEKFSEKLLSMYLRAELGESDYWQITNTNPINYLRSTLFEIGS